MVFVACSTSDADWLDELRRMTSEAASSWVIAPGIEQQRNWHEPARETIEKSDAFLFVTSMQSVRSEHCLWELSTARELGKPCFQWIVEPVEDDHDAASLPVLASGRQPAAQQWRFDSPHPGG